MITNGFRASHRNRWLMVKEGVLTVPEMVLLDFYIDKMNFSSTSEDVGTFDLDFVELEIYLDRKEKTIRALNKNLLEKGFIKWINPNKYAVTHWERYILDKKDKTGGQAFKFQQQEYNLPIESLIQNLGINFQIVGKEHEDIAESSTPAIPLSNILSRDSINTNTQNSFLEEKKTTKNIEENRVGTSAGKVDFSLRRENLSFEYHKEVTSTVVSDSNNADKRVKNVAGQFPKWVLIQQEPRTDQEYQSIQNEQADDMKMTIEDMKWIDQNASGFVKVEDEDKEKWTVEIYFGGDRAKYENYLEPSRTRAIINYYPKIG